MVNILIIGIFLYKVLIRDIQINDGFPFHVQMLQSLNLCSKVEHIYLNGKHRSQR